VGKRNLFIGLIIFFVYLSINLAILKDYALSWDYHYHHYAGLFHLGEKVPKISEPDNLPYSAPDPRLTTEDPFGPFTQIIPSLSQVIFTDRFNILPFDAAYNLPMVFFGAAGVFVLFIFLLEAFGLTVAVAGSLALSLHPSYFGYIHNNMKDVPNSFAFALSIYLFWRLTNKKNLSSLLYACLAFAFAFNVKINSIMIPVISGIYFFITGIGRYLQNKKYFVETNLKVISYFLLAPILAITLWWPFWSDPLEKLLELPRFYSLNTINMPVLYLGKMIRSGINIPFHYPYVYLAVATPLLILLPSILGIVISLIQSIKNSRRYLLILLWFFIPLARYLSPKTGAIDGVRHFMEILFPLSAFTGIGLNFIYKTVSNTKKLKALKLLSGVFFISALSWNLIRLHPYQTSYFNSLTGGISGAQGKFDIDFWGTPQREAVLWLNENAPFGSYVNIVMAQATAATYLRPDLLLNANKKAINESDYVVLLNRQSFYDLYGVGSLLSEKEKSGKIVFKVSRQGVALVWVFSNSKLK